MSGLEERLKWLEQKVTEHDKLFSKSPHPDNEGAMRHEGESNGPSSPSLVRSSKGISLHESELQELSPEEMLGGGMAITFVEEEDSAYFGQFLPSNLFNETDFSRPFLKYCVHAPHWTCDDR